MYTYAYVRTEENVEYKDMKLHVADLGYTDGERKKLSREKKEEFKRAAAEALGLPLRAFSSCTFHHVVPLYLGGTSDFSNITLIRRGAHKSAHVFIGAQTAEARPGDDVSVVIPFPKNPWVWDLRDYFDENGVSFYTKDDDKRSADWLVTLREELSIYSETNRKKTIAAAVAGPALVP